MACPGCNYDSGCANYVTVSYTPTLNSHGPSPISYSHSAIYTGEQNLAPGNIQYIGDSSNGYSSLPREINYHISDVLKDSEVKKSKTENLPAVRNEVMEVLPPSPDGELMHTQPQKELTPEQREIMEALSGQLIDDNQENLPPGSVRITEVEEEMIMIRKRKVRVTTLKPEERNLKRVN